MARSLSGRLHVAAGVIGIALSILSLVPAYADSPMLPLRVYNTVALSDSMLGELQRTAGRALADAGIVLDWRRCGELVAQNGCPTAYRPTEIVVRIVEVHPGMAEDKCGFAVATNGGGGFISLSTACANRATRRLQRGDLFPEVAVRMATMLGYTLAHELAHVLLPGSPHSADGIFTSRLNRRHWDRARSGTLSFLREDLERLREASRRRENHGT